jgi:hypothetical protein
MDGSDERQPADASMVNPATVDMTMLGAET